MKIRQAVLLRQFVKGVGMQYRLRLGETGSGPVLIEWPAELSVDEALEAATSYGAAYSLTLNLRRDWLEWHLPHWPEETLLATPDGIGTILDYDAEQRRYLVRFDREAEPRPYFADRLIRLRAMYLASELNRAAQELVDSGVAGDVALRSVIQARGATMVAHSDPHEPNSGYREIWELPDGLRVNLWLSGLYGGAERAGAEWSLRDLGVEFDWNVVLFDGNGRRLA